jgi:hypothetical protein
VQGGVLGNDTDAPEMEEEFNASVNEAAWKWYITSSTGVYVAGGRSLGLNGGVEHDLLSRPEGMYGGREEGAFLREVRVIDDKDTNV